MATQPICQIITPVGMMGYGFDEALVHRELAHLVPTGIPTAIILDSGSTDSGPQKLALGSMSCPRSAYAKDLSKLLQLVHTFQVPLIFSSAGGDGTDDHVRVMGEIIEEIAAEEENKDYCFQTISIFSSIDKTTILKRLKAGRVTGCGPCVSPATEMEIEASPRVVAQMGPEPFIDAMEANPNFNIIIGGRAYDPAPYVAYAVHQLKRQLKNISAEDIQSRIGGFLHMGKIMECGGQCSLPKSHGAVSTVYASGFFDVRPIAAGSICTPLSVAAHTLYENTRPDILRGPGGALYLEDTKYEQLADGRSVRVSGSKYRPSKADEKSYQLKLEAARVVGYRSMFLGSVKDQILVAQIDDVLARVKAYVKEQHSDVSVEWELDFHLYGKSQRTAAGPGEIFVVAEALAPTKQLASSIASKARVAMIHAPYPGQKATAGNFGFGIGGLMEIEMGPCAEFSLYHLMDLEPGEERLVLDDKKAGSWIENGRLLRGSVATIGNGLPTPSNVESRAKIAQLRDNLPKISANAATLVVESSTKKSIRNPKTLSDLCRILRSKNAGPYEITIDAVFYSEADYRSVKDSKLLSPTKVARALGISKDKIIWMGFFDPALAFKVTIPRVRSGRQKSAGGFMENDVHGSQEHLGLARLELPKSRTSILARMFGTYEWSRLLAIVAALGSVGILSVVRRLLERRK
ncbi:Fc.00g093600.m01.CDS01 [Cosmosporella sp. VM-42]